MLELLLKDRLVEVRVHAELDLSLELDLTRLSVGVEEGHLEVDRAWGNLEIIAGVSQLDLLYHRELVVGVESPDSCGGSLK